MKKHTRMKKHTPGPDGRRCECEYDANPHYHYHCANCGADCTAGEPAGPAHTDVDGVTRCDACSAAHSVAQGRLRSAAPDLADALEKARAALLLVGRLEVVRGEARYYTSGQCLIHQDQIRDCGTACIEAEAALRKAGRLE